ncbi:MAG: adenine phosphoribosyltransferase [Nanoarchaeota archaeon]|nr:adenine phosphoribosyltransferase [Nanoarchaeota archaeon]
MNLQEYIRTVENFPKPGISFKDISPLVSSPEALKEVISQLKEKIDFSQVDKIAGFDARGFLFGPLLSVELGIPFVMIRKKGKLPGNCVEISYDLEYGSAEIEIQEDAIHKGENVVLIDDLLATGGTAKAGCDLVEKLGGNVFVLAFIIELEFLEGKKLFDKYQVESLIKY